MFVLGKQPIEVTRLIEHTPIASVLSAPREKDNPIIACNQLFCDLTGYGPDDVLGRNCRFLSGPGTEIWLSDEIRRGVAEHTPVLVEILNYKRDGTPFRNAVMVAPVFDGDNELNYFVGSQIEIADSSIGPSTSRRLTAAARIKELSPRQRQVLTLAAKGLQNKQIAARLDVAEKTVKMHRAILMDRLRVHTIADMIRFAVEAGL